MSRGQRCGDIDLAGYLANVAGPVPSVLDLRIAHERFGSSSDSEPSINGRLHHPNDVDRSLYEAAADKLENIALTVITIPLTLSPLCLLLLVRLEAT